MRGALVCSQAEELIYLWKHYANKMTALPIKQCIMFLRQYYVIFLLKLRQDKLHTNLLFKLLPPNWDWKYNRDLIFNVSGDGFFIRSISLFSTKPWFFWFNKCEVYFRQKVRKDAIDLQLHGPNVEQFQYGSYTFLSHSLTTI